MRWSEIDFRPEDRKLRQFAVLLLLVCAAIAGVLEVRRGAVDGLPAVLLAIGAFWAVTGIVLPTLIRPLFVALTVAAFPIGWLVSRIVLAVIYYLVLTPIGLLLRLTRHDPLGLEHGDRDTFWKPVKASTDRASYFRQF